MATTLATDSRATVDRGAAAVPPPSRGLYRFAVGVVLAVLVLIKAGAMVTSTGSGLAFSDWPLANGSLWPPDMHLDGLFEHGHRAIGMTIGLLVLTLTIWVCRVDRRPWLRKLVIACGGLVAIQAVLGGKGVEWGLPPATSIAHGVLAQVILCLLTLVAFALSPTWVERHPADPGQVTAARRLASTAVALVFCQLLAGAVLRHTNAQGVLWLHVTMALVVALVITLTGLYCSTRFEAQGFGRLGRAVLLLLLLQLTLGFVTLGVRRVKDPSNIDYLGRSLVVTSHVVVGALLFLTSALLLYRVARNLRPAGAR